MHELAIAESICAIVEESSAGRRVARVVVEVGKLSAVMPEALRFSFDAVTDGTSLAGAELVLVERRAEARCRACAVVFEPEFVVAQCACGSVDVEWMSGDQLRVLEMEVVDDVRDVRVQ